MVPKNSSNKKILILLFLFVCLTGCHPFVKYPNPPFTNKATAAGAIGGAATGAVVSSSAAGAGIGAIVGTGIGTYVHSTVHWLKVLQADGVQVIQVGHKVTIVIPSDKIFIIHTSKLRPHHHYILYDVSQFIENYGPVCVTVNAYTDNVGSTLDNYRLSVSQAKSVLGFLWSHGIPSSRLRSVGHGRADPIAENTDPQGSAWNRRIELKFSYG